MATNQAFVARSGMITAVGGTGELTSLAVAAGMNCYSESSYVNRDGFKMKLAQVPSDALGQLADTLKEIKMSKRHKRCVLLASIAIEEALSGEENIDDVPLFLGLPEPIPGCVDSIQSNILSHIALQSGIGFDVGNSRVFRSGRASGMLAIDLAFQYFEATGKSRVIIGGVDSFVDPTVLGVLDLHGRVLAEERLDAFAPGEGAGFILLSSQAVKEKVSQKGTQLFRPSLAAEPGHLYSDEPNLGAGLTSVFKQAQLASGNDPIDRIYSSFNGESIHNKEYGIAVLRNSSRLSEGFELEHPGDCFGDIGAAFAPVLISLAHHNYVGKSLVFCCSDNENRGAMVVKTYG